MSQGSPLHLMVAVEEIKRLRAFLPHTKDGKLIQVEECYYCLPKGGSVIKVQVTKIMFQMQYDYWWCAMTKKGSDPDYDFIAPAHELYSTEPLAWVAWKEEQ